MANTVRLMVCFTQRLVPTCLSSYALADALRNRLDAQGGNRVRGLDV